MQYDIIDNVSILKARNTIFSPACVVAYALHQLLGHLDFRVANHYIKDVVIVGKKDIILKFKSALSVFHVQGPNLNQGTLAQKPRIMMATKVSKLRSCVSERMA